MANIAASKFAHYEPLIMILDKQLKSKHVNGLDFQTLYDEILMLKELHNEAEVNLRTVENYVKQSKLKEIIDKNSDL